MSSEDEKAEIQMLDSALKESEDEKERLKEQLGRLAKVEWDREKKEFIAFVRETRGPETARELDQKIQPDSPYSLDTYKDAFGFGKTQTSQAPAGYVSLPETPKLAEGSTYADLEHMITDLSTKALRGDKVAKEKLRRLTEIAIQISTQSQKSGNISKVLGNVAFSACPRCGKASTTDFNIRGVKCRYCGFESGTKKLFQSRIRGE